MLRFDIRPELSFGGGTGLTFPSGGITQQNASTAVNNAVGGVLNSILPGSGLLAGLLDVGSWFGNYTSAERFMQDGEIKLKAIMDRFTAKAQSNPSFAISELHRELKFTLMESEVNLANSRKPRSRNGNANTVRVFNEALSNFDKMIKKYGEAYNIKVTPKSSRFKNSGQYTYNSYELSAKTRRQNPVDTNTPKNTTTTTNNGDGASVTTDDNIYDSPWYVVIVVVVIGAVALGASWLYKKFKNRKKKKK